MAKSKKSRRPIEPHVKPDESNSGVLSFLAQKDAIDPSLALLFASSAELVRPSPKESHDIPRPPVKRELHHSSPSLDFDAEEDSAGYGLSGMDGRLESLVSIQPTGTDSPSKLSGTSNLESCGVKSKNFRKRKRLIDEDGLEEKYLLRIRKEEGKEEEARQAKRRSNDHRLTGVQGLDPVEGNLDTQNLGELATPYGVDAKENNGRTLDNPVHETLMPDSGTNELEKSTRTVFVGNVSIVAITDKKAKKILLEHMVSFVGLLPVSDGGKNKHKVESIRFRSTAYTGGGIPKKAAYVTKSLMAATTKSTNAYVVYSTALAAREAMKRLNGSIVLDRHIRVDGVAHPAKTDHRRCVFVGNLGFVDDESIVDEDGNSGRKHSKTPSDVEEGLWRQFGKVGIVESVRVVRDEKTRVGKGFAYVQFQDTNSVEAALLFHGKKFPPMLPRVLRVTRAKAVRKTASASQRSQLSNRPLVSGSGSSNQGRIYEPKVSTQQLSLQGRAAKLLGRAGAANIKGNEGLDRKKHSKGLRNIARSPETIVFEGFRASAKSRKPDDLKLSGKGKKSKLKKGRSIKRANDWRKSGRRSTK